MCDGLGQPMQRWSSRACGVAEIHSVALIALGSVRAHATQRFQALQPMGWHLPAFLPVWQVRRHFSFGSGVVPVQNVVQRHV